MAAIYSGIHLKLKSPHTPWTDKLKLARFAWISPQCVLPNKEQVLFDWISHALTLSHSKKIDLAQDVVEGLWVYFDDIIHSKKLKNVLSQGKTVSLRITVAQVINDRILEHSSGQPSVALATVLSCLRGILSSPVLSVTYTAKYELLGELLARLSHLACSRLDPQHSGEPLPAHELEVLLLTLATYLAVQRQQGNANRVFTQVTTHLLQPLLVLRYLLSARTWAEEDGSEVRLRQQVSKEIRSKVDSVLQVALFFPDNLQWYKDELLPSLTEEPAAGRKGRGGKGLPAPLSTVLAKLCVPGSCDPAVLYAVVSTSLPLLFKFALDAFCKGGENKLLCFHLMTKFVCALDFNDNMTLKETFDAGNWNLALLALENLLNSCLSGDIYNVAADRIQHGEVQLKFYRRLTQLLFNNAQTATPAWYRCLKTLLALNHMIVEPDLDELVSSVWVDSDCTELRVCKARDALISATLNTYAKLRQLPRLFDELLNVVCRPAMDELRPPLLSEVVGETLTLCLMNTPASQSLELCELVLERLQSDVLPDAREQDAANVDAALKLFSLSALLHVLFFSLKTLDNATPLPVIRQTQRLMGEMLGVLKPLLEWLRDLPPSGTRWGQKVREASLLLTYTWVEMDALYQLHCSKYSLSGDTGSSGVKDEGLWLLSEALVKDWDQAALEGYSPVGQLFQKFLAMQMMKKILLRNSFATDGNNLDVLHQASRFIVGKDELSPTQFDQLWDLQVSSVDADSYPAAHWYLVTTNLPLIAPFLSEEDVAYLASLLLTAVMSRSAKEDGDKQGLSVAVISKQLLDSVILIELPSLYSAVVRGIMQSVTQICDTQHVGNVCPALLKACEEFSSEGCDVEVTTGEVGEWGVDPAVIKRLESAAQQILTTLESGSAIELSVAQVGDLASVLKVSRTLNVDGMSVKDYAELFLITFMLATCTQPCIEVEVPVRVAFLRDTYCFLTSLLTGRNAQSILKLARGSRLLEGAVTSLFSHANKGLSDNVSEADWSSLLQAMRCFLQRLLELIIERKSSMRLNLEQFTSFLLARSEAEVVARAGSATARLSSLQLSLASLGTAADVMTSSLGKSKQLDQTLMQLLGRILTVTGAVVQASLSSGMARAGAAGQAFSVDVVAGMVRSELACLSHQAEEPEAEAEAEAPVALSHMGLYRSCGQQILKELCPAPRPMDFLLSSLHFLPAYYSAAERTNEPGIKEVFVDILHAVYKLLSAPWLSEAQLQQLLTPVRNLIGQLVATSSLEQFHHLLLLLREGLDGSKVTEGNHREVFSAVTVIRLLASCELPESCLKAFWLIAPQIISALVFIVKESGKEPSPISALTIPALEALSVLLRQGEGLLSNPHHVTLALGAAQFVPLEHLSAQDYHAAFEAIHELLFAIIQCHTQVMLGATPAFLNCFYRLVASIMSEGKQRGEVERASEKDGGELVKCARLVERMYSHIAAATEGFTVLSSFMAAQYVSELQKVTLRPEIKAHLTEGIYSILDLCADRDVKFLSSTLPQGLREVFSELYGSYQHYHKAQRQGEDKYTA